MCGDFNVFFALITDLKSDSRYDLNFPKNRQFKVGSACGRQVYSRDLADNPKQKACLSLSDTFRVLGRRKQNMIPNVSASYVSSGDLVPW